MTFGTDFLYLNAIFGFANDVNTGNGVLDAFVAVFYSSEGISTPGAIVFNFMGFITDQIGGGIALGMENAGAAEWAQGLVNDGIWGGLSGILSFIPQILVLFLFISILEDSGYMARVAFILDRAFRKFGLSGRAFIPMIMGFGCSVPAAINTRTLADEKERIMTNRVIPFFTCGAKAPILAAVCGALAAHYTNLDGGLLTFALYVFGMVMARAVFPHGFGIFHHAGGPVRLQKRYGYQVAGHSGRKRPGNVRVRLSGRGSKQCTVRGDNRLHPFDDRYLRCQNGCSPGKYLHHLVRISGGDRLHVPFLGLVDAAMRPKDERSIRGAS